MVGMLVAGFGLVLAGLLAIGYGVQYKEFSVGSTLILSGVFAVCTGALMFGFWLTVRELRSLSRSLGTSASTELESESELPMPTAAARGSRPAGGPESGLPFNRDQAAVASERAPAAGQPPWYHEAAARDRARGEAPPAAPPAAEPEEGAPRRRNLLFSSTRKDRERSGEPLSPDLSPPEQRQNPSAGPGQATDSNEPQTPTFDDTWPRPERQRPSELPPRRMPRTPPAAPSESPPAPVADRRPPKPQEQPPVTVLKSGVVDGMAYSLYSDGSIEAQMPEGMMRFGSIDELRAHLEQRS